MKILNNLKKETLIKQLKRTKFERKIQSRKPPKTVGTTIWSILKRKKKKKNVLFSSHEVLTREKKKMVKFRILDCNFWLSKNIFFFFLFFQKQQKKSIMYKIWSQNHISLSFCIWGGKRKDEEKLGYPFQWSHFFFPWVIFPFEIHFRFCF